MVESLKKSKFEWFDEIPLSWGESKISYLFEIGRGRVISQQELKENGKFPVYSSQTKDNGCMGMIETYDFDDNLITWTTDGANAGTVFIREGKFNCTNVCGTLKPILDIELKYYYYYLQFVTQFYKRPDTNGAKIMNNEMANIHALIPPKQTQIRIAEFLDKKTAEIDTIIQKKESLLLLLEEKKKAIINEAITGKKVWNGNAWTEPVEVKDSGIEWLGEIPEHWELTQLKYLTEKVGSGVTPRGGAEVYTEEGVKFIRSQNVYFDGLRLDDVVFIDEKTHLQMENSKVVFNDVLLNITGGSIGRSCVVEMNEEFNVNQHVCIIRPTDELNSKYLNYFLYSNIGQTQIRLGITGGNREGLNFENLKSFIIPKLNVVEQELIVDTIKSKVLELNSISNKIQAQINKLKEYRQSLISEAVTGKIDI
ncbi:restriction endonuclease subunit S [Chryseobacterium sp. Hurlbut01]|uniref:restriction endonuclease subunit S n=1 Tax=Chryseobacterium sp. Hurlbut01 TaxID=1681828 RepID=UPI00067A9C8F|nr:restriction endonuclease subunit S [Chryseobacterium sp. Hurlbut01]KNB63117.1 hypothetical protein AC804_00450 [Chryseobacterium sp. Hurlbut01]